MVNRLLAVWAGLDILYLCSGVLALIVAIVFKMQSASAIATPGDNTLRALVVSEMNTNSGIALGIIIIASWTVGIYGIITSRRIHKTCTTGLKWFNWSVVGASIATIVVGCSIWFFTLQPRNQFAKLWVQQPLAVQSFLQDSLQCCGYWNATSQGLFQAATGFCASVASGTNTTAVQPCVNPIGLFEDSTLNNIFSTIFGFSVIQVCLVLITICVCNVQMEAYRFSLIDAKRGGGAKHSYA